MLLQVPLVLLFINRIRPLRPSTLFKKERWVILGAFIMGGIMDPSPTVISQVMLAIPVVVAYQVGIILVWRTNRRSRHSPKVRKLLETDAQVQATRLHAAANALFEFSGGEQIPVAAPVEPVGLSIAEPFEVNSSSEPDTAILRSARKISRRLYVNDVRPRKQLDHLPLQNA